MIEITSHATDLGPMYSILYRDGRRFTSRAVVVAPGRTPQVPLVFSDSLGQCIFHLSSYLPALSRYEQQYGKPRHACVLGGSQSAVELILDLSSRYPEASIVGLHRGFGNKDVEAVESSDDSVTLLINDKHRNERSRIESDLVVLATGFRNLGQGQDEEALPPLLASLADLLKRDEYVDLAVARDYSLSGAGPGIDLAPIYLNGLCERSHGMGDAGSFSLLSLRAAEILESLTEALRHETRSLSQAS